MKIIQISIITLSKNDHFKFLKTLKSIQLQKINFNIEWIVIDGSNKKTHRKNKQYIRQKFRNKENTVIRHINSNKSNLEGIYPCMNYGKSISRGKFIIFLNSGDTFFNKNSLNIFFKNTLNLTTKNNLIFGQANIIASKKINWFFPGKKLKSIKNWLKFFEPNHQAMLISNKLAKQFNFSNEYNIIGDGYWKRKIIDSANEIIYIKLPLIKFYLDGVSSTKPSKRILNDLIKNKKISIFRKIIFIIKYLFPTKIFSLYYLMQKYKSKLFDLLM